MALLDRRLLKIRRFSFYGTPGIMATPRSAMECAQGVGVHHSRQRMACMVTTYNDMNRSQYCTHFKTLLKLTYSGVISKICGQSSGEIAYLISIMS